MAFRATFTTSQDTPSCTTRQPAHTVDGSIRCSATPWRTWIMSRCSFSDSVHWRGPGDLLLFDVDYGFTTVIEAAEIQRKDPALHNPLPEPSKRWLGGPITRYARMPRASRFLFGSTPIVRSVEATWTPDHCDRRAPGKRTKEFCMIQNRRYEPKSLVQCLQNLGWDSLGVFPFSGSRHDPRAVPLPKAVPRLKH